VSKPGCRAAPRWKKTDLLAGALELHNAVPYEFRVPVGKGSSESGQEAFDVAFTRADESGQGVVVHGRGSGFAVILGFVLESGDVDDSAAAESLCLVGGRNNSGCGRQLLLRQTDGHVVVAEDSQFCSVCGDVALWMSRTVVAEIHVELSVKGGENTGGVMDRGSIGDLLGTVEAVNRNISVVRNLRFIWNIQVCG